MIKYSTPNELLRLLEEQREDDSLIDMPVNEGLGLLQDMLNQLFAEPPEDCIRKVLEYSRSLNM